MSLMFAPQEADSAELPAGTKLLGGLYHIEEPLQQGGFAMTYIARDSLDRHVVIKECFPAEICERREGHVHARTTEVEAQFWAVKQQFLREARGVATLKHPHVVAVHQVFEENNTAYMALDYVAGMDLISVLEDEPERLDANFIETTLKETLKALRHIHGNGILHRDIAPDNIRVDGSDRITLIDFGAAGARGAKSGSAEGALPSVKDGYSPPEFYGLGETQDFSSDLYSLAATFHHLITGKAPPDGPTRSQAQAMGEQDPYVPLAPGPWACGHHVLTMIDLALSLAREQRPQSADLWLSALDELPKVRPVPPQPLVFDPLLEVTISELVLSVNTYLSTAPAVNRNVSRPWRNNGSRPVPRPENAPDSANGPGRPLAGLGRPPMAGVRLINPRYDELAFPVVPEFESKPTAEAPVDLHDSLPVRKSFLGSIIARYLPKSPQTCPS